MKRIIMIKDINAFSDDNIYVYGKKEYEGL